MRATLLYAMFVLLAASCGNTQEPAAASSAGSGNAAVPAPTAAAGSASSTAGMAAMTAGAGGGGAGMATAGNTGASGGTAATPATCDGIEPAILNLTPAQLDQMLADKNFELINVHTPRAGQITGTDVHIPFTDIAGLETRLGHDHAAKAVLYCRSGSMSLMAATTLVSKGYCKIYDLPGGMNGWTAAGFPLMQ